MQNFNDVESTSDCLEILNEYKPSKWKRKTKFKIKLGEESANEVRIFSDGIETLSIVQTECDGSFLVNFDLSTLRPLIEKIQALAKKYYTHDYGQVFLNPWEMKVWVVGGDGGIIYSEKSAMTIINEIEEGTADFDTQCPGFELRIPEIKGTFVEGEYFPPLCEGDIFDTLDADLFPKDGNEPTPDDCQIKMEWIQVAMATDLCNIM